MNKTSLIILGVLMFIPVLIRKVLVGFGVPLSPQADLYLFLGVATFFANKIVVPKEYQKYTKWFAILFLLLLISAF
jgi:hypothetical protein